jgi:hypothetical protein
VKRSEAVERARDAAALSRVRQVGYGLGQGGMRPERHVPWTKARLCDCSGALAWFWRLSRQLEAIRGGWVESTILFTDATTTREVVRVLEPGERPEPGDALVKPDQFVSGKKVAEGHVALITEVDVHGTPFRMVDCSSSGGREGNAIRERLASAFPAGGVVVRLKALENG